MNEHESREDLVLGVVLVEQYSVAAFVPNQGAKSCEIFLKICCQLFLYVLENNSEHGLMSS